MFSNQTVQNIETLYDMHRPPEFERYLPDWMTKEVFWHQRMGSFDVTAVYAHHVGAWLSDE